jgi:F0F1-type ATP synthase epsilon subunit
MTDVFEDWKKNKFIIVDAAMIDITDANLIILTDVSYWNENYDALKEWCTNYSAEVRGMTVTCDDPALTAFCLRW